MSIKRELHRRWHECAKLTPTELPDLHEGEERWAFTWSELSQSFRTETGYWEKILDEHDLVIRRNRFDGMLYVDVVAKGPCPCDECKKSREMTAELVEVA
jgi:hypothetical protein